MNSQRCSLLHVAHASQTRRLYVVIISKMIMLEKKSRLKLYVTFLSWEEQSDLLFFPHDVMFMGVMKDLIRVGLMNAHLAVVTLLPVYLGVWISLNLSQQRVVKGLWPAGKVINAVWRNSTYYLTDTTVISCYCFLHISVNLLKVRLYTLM